MSGAEKRWAKINERIRTLEKADHEEEPDILWEAYDCLILAYQEARELNTEMEELVKDVMAGRL